MSYDPEQDRLVELTPKQAPPDALILVEGMFMHRDELVQRWDASVFLDVAFVETARRMSIRDGTNADPQHPSMHRYVEGQRLYFARAEPWKRASIVIYNSDFSSPHVIRASDALNAC